MRPAFHSRYSFSILLDEVSRMWNAGDCTVYIGFSRTKKRTTKSYRERKKTRKNGLIKHNFRLWNVTAMLLRRFACHWIGSFFFCSNRSAKRDNYNFFSSFIRCVLTRQMILAATINFPRASSQLATWIYASYLCLLHISICVCVCECVSVFFSLLILPTRG